MGKILIIGAGGMLGHKLCQCLSGHEVYATIRKDVTYYDKYSQVYEGVKLISGVDVFDLGHLASTINEISPDVVINCVGIIKQLDEANDPIISLKINSLLPHELARISKANNARLIHISTDCVFDGKDGNYTEDFPSNAKDLYGRTKFLGEVNQPGCLTMRTSIIGRELYTVSGLVEWFLSCNGGKVKGFKKAIYTGFTTRALVTIIDDIIRNHPDLSGLYQVSSERIDKYSLLCMIRDIYKLDIEIGVEEDTVIDRGLDSSRYRAETGFCPPKWEEMIKEMYEDKTPYDKWHE